MHIDFSVVSQNLARTYGDAECMVNVERNRRYSFGQYHRLTNRIITTIGARPAGTGGRGRQITS